jgi:hypothetical protein
VADVSFPSICEVALPLDEKIKKIADRQRDWYARFIGLIAWFSSLYDGTQFVFRGHAEAQWPLNSHLWRQSGATNEADLRRAERRILGEVQRDFWFERDFDFEPLDNDLRTLAVLQHHGIPTRLIDVTADPLVALYFAVAGTTVANAHDRVDGALYMMRRPTVGSGPLPYRVRASPQTTPRVTAQRSLFLSPLRPKQIEAQEILLVGDLLIDTVSVNCKGASEVADFSALAGRFLAGTRIGRPSRYAPNVLRFIVPASAKATCRDGLRSLGVSAINLFPGLDGYRRDLLVEGRPISEPSP